jgi:hypothetical protein
MFKQLKEIGLIDLIPKGLRRIKRVLGATIVSRTYLFFREKKREYWANGITPTLKHKKTLLST